MLCLSAAKIVQTERKKSSLLELYSEPPPIFAEDNVQMYKPYHISANNLCIFAFY